MSQALRHKVMPSPVVGQYRQASAPIGKFGFPVREYTAWKDPILGVHWPKVCASQGAERLNVIYHSGSGPGYPCLRMFTSRQIRRLS